MFSCIFRIAGTVMIGPKIRCFLIFSKYSSSTPHFDTTCNLTLQSTMTEVLIHPAGPHQHQIQITTYCHCIEMRNAIILYPIKTELKVLLYLDIDLSFIYLGKEERMHRDNDHNSALILERSPCQLFCHPG